MSRFCIRIKANVNGQVLNVIVLQQCTCSPLPCWAVIVKCIPKTSILFNLNRHYIAGERVYSSSLTNIYQVRRYFEMVFIFNQVFLREMFAIVLYSKHEAMNPLVSFV